MSILALLLLAALPPQDDSTEKTFGDWAVACDNSGRCEAVALVPESRLDDAPFDFKIARDAGPDGGVTLGGDAFAQGPVDLVVNGKVVARALAGSREIGLAGPAAERVANAMATGRGDLVLRSPTGTLIARISLTGVSATLRYIDARQGRAGGVTALVAKGGKPKASVPAARDLPRIAARRPTRGAMQPLAPAQEAGMRARGECDLSPEEMNEIKSERHRLDAGTTLVLLPCALGAYNLSSAVFVLTPRGISPAQFDSGVDGESEAGVPLIINTNWDEETGVLSSFTKGRGLGDCGSVRDWVWDGERFRMIRSEALDVCRGSTAWPVVFRAEPVWR